MAIKIGDNFNYQGEKFNFERDCFVTLEAMKNFNEAGVPDQFQTFCLETNKLYRINKSITSDDVTGKWVEVAGFDSNGILNIGNNSITGTSKNIVVGDDNEIKNGGNYKGLVLGNYNKLNTGANTGGIILGNSNDLELDENTSSILIGDGVKLATGTKKNIIISKDNDSVFDLSGAAPSVGNIIIGSPMNGSYLNSTIFNAYKTTIKSALENGLALGDNNIAEAGGKSSIILGSNNTLKNGSCTIVSGYGNTSESGANNSIIIGKDNYVASSPDNSVISGKGNSLKYCNGSTILSGDNNICTTADSSIISGKNNNIKGGKPTLSFGVNINKNTTGLSTVLGQGLNILEDKQTALLEGITYLGRYNSTSEDENRTLFVIGNGTSDDDRKNAFEIKENGDIYVEGVNGRIQDKLNSGTFDANGNLISGDTITKELDVHNIILGDNTITYVEGGSTAPQGVHNSIIQGDSNELLADGYCALKGLHIAGDSNSITQSFQGSIFGNSNNIIQDTENFSIHGNNNSTKAGSKNIEIFGNDNTVSSSTCAFILGNSNNLNANGGSYCCIAAFGEKLTIEYGSTNNIVSGSDNIVSSSKNSAIFGNGNKTYSGYYNILGGKSNKLNYNSNNNLVVGTLNDVQDGICNSIICGSENTISCRVNNNVISGSKNNFSSESNVMDSIIGGKNNTSIVSVNSSIVVGDDNEFLENANFYNAIFGCKNNIKNVSEAAFGMYNNSTSSKTLFTVGIGTSDANRKNAFEIQNDGMIYIDGIVESLQSTINTLKQTVSSLQAELSNRFPFKITSFTGGKIAEKGTTQSITLTWVYDGTPTSQSLGDGTFNYGDVSTNLDLRSKLITGITSNTTFTLTANGNKTATQSISFYNCKYVGTVSIAPTTEAEVKALTKLAVASNKSYTWTGNLDNTAVCYCYPKTFGTLSSVKDANNFDYLSGYTRTEVTVNGEAYYVYVSGKSISNNFKQIFA